MHKETADPIPASEDSNVIPPTFRSTQDKIASKEPRWSKAQAEITNAKDDLRSIRKKLHRLYAKEAAAQAVLRNAEAARDAIEEELTELGQKRQKEGNA